ncbi:MAG: 6-carboxytetrahydropterin synthase [Bacteroidota bacterium]
MPTVYVTRKAYFNAAHRLHNADQSDDWNRETFGKCNSPNWHGHNYELDVTVAGEPDPATGFVFDLGRLKGIINEHVIEPLDHKNLNLDVPFLKGKHTSTETLAIAVWEQLAPHVPGLFEVSLRETHNNAVVYRGE